MIGAARAVTIGAGGESGYRFYRLHITSRSGSFGSVNVAEITFSHPKFPTGRPSGGTASASSSASGYGPANAFDGLSDTVWRASTTNLPQWLQYELAQPLALKGYGVRAPSQSGGAARSPGSWTFEGSKDGLTWDVLDTQSGVSWVEGQVRNYAL